MLVAQIDRELEQARDSGPVRDIIIPPCPELLVALQNAVRQGDPEPGDIAHIASSDVAMAAALMRTANSPLYARSRAAETVAQAIAVLGLAQTVGILTAFLVRHAIRIPPGLIEHFWETSTRRALAMGFIARELYGVDAGLAHTCGLFCHVGIPVMLQGVRGYSGTLAEALARQDRSFTETENASHRTDHAVVGAIVARTWRLPSAIGTAVRLHHDFSVLGARQCPPDIQRLVAMLAVAEHLVAQFEGVERQPEWVQYGPQCLQHIAVDAGELELWQDRLNPAFDQAALH